MITIITTIIIIIVIIIIVNTIVVVIVVICITIIIIFFLSKVSKYISDQKIYKAGELASSYTRFTKEGIYFLNLLVGNG